MYKKGFQHIEFIISIVLFVGFLLFALYFFNPLNTQRVVDSSLYYAIDEISQNITTKVMEYSVVFSRELLVNKVSFPVANPENHRVLVLTNEGLELPSIYQNGKIIVDRNDNEYIVIKFSDEFEDGTTITGFEEITSDLYTISSSQERDYWSEKKAQALKDSYEANYVVLRNYFNLPDRIGFGFRFDILGGSSIVADQEIPQEIEVFSDSERKEIIDINGNIKFADLTVKVW